MGEREPTKGIFGRTELDHTLHEVFQRFGYGCLAVETDIGVVHICHAADADIESFADKPVQYQWQLIPMPTPLAQAPSSCYGEGKHSHS